MRNYILYLFFQLKAERKKPPSGPVISSAPQPRIRHQGRPELVSKSRKNSFVTSLEPNTMTNQTARTAGYFLIVVAVIAIGLGIWADLRSRVPIIYSGHDMLTSIWGKYKS